MPSGRDAGAFDPAMDVEERGEREVDRPTWRRRVLLGLSYLLFLLVLLEVGSFAILSLRSGGLASAQRMHEEMAVAAKRAGATMPRSEPDFGAGIHPYLGFLTRDGPGQRPIEGAVQLNQQAFYDGDSPIFARREQDVVIALVGGSVADQFTRLGGCAALARDLADVPAYAGKELRFVLLAQRGGKQPQQLIALNYVLALGGTVDVLINLDGFNEIALHERENQNQGVAPVYPRAWFFRVQRVEIITILAELNELRRSRRALARDASSSVLRHLWTYRLRWKWSDGGLGRSIAALEDPPGPATGPGPPTESCRSPHPGLGHTQAHA